MMAEAKPRGGAVSAGKIGDGARLSATERDFGRLGRKLVAFSRKWLKHISLGTTSPVALLRCYCPINFGSMRFPELDTAAMFQCSETRRASTVEHIRTVCAISLSSLPTYSKYN